MEILGKYLTLIDSFGVPIQLQTLSGNKLFKSSVGGLSTIILYTISLAYFIFIITEWQLGKIAPKISTALKTPGVIKVDLQKNFLNLGLFNQSSDSIDPFRQFDNIITPFIISIDDMSVSQPKPIFSQLINVNYATDPKHQISFDALTFVSYTGESFEENKDEQSKQFFLIFKTCDISFIQGNYTCASTEVISEFINNFRGVIDINTQIQQYNPQKGTTATIVKTQYFVIDNQIPTFSQISLSTTNEIQNTGILFDSFKSQVIIHNTDLTIQPITKEFSKKYFGFEVLSSIMVSLNPIQTEEIIVDPKLGEVLAQVGSLISLLLTVKTVIQYYNLWKLDQEIYESVISKVYPKYKQLTIRRNIIGTIQDVKYNSLKIDLKQFNQKYNQIKDMIQEKLKITSIISTLLKERDKQIENKNIIQISKIYPMNDEQDNHSGRSSMQNEDFDLEIVFTQIPFQYKQ